jgi:hypothetical protein
VPTPHMVVAVVLTPTPIVAVPTGDRILCLGRYAYPLAVALPDLPDCIKHTAAPHRHARVWGLFPTLFLFSLLGAFPKNSQYVFHHLSLLIILASGALGLRKYCTASCFAQMFVYDAGERSYRLRERMWILRRIKMRGMICKFFSQKHTIAHVEKILILLAI